VGGSYVELTKEQIEQNAKMVEALEAKGQTSEKTNVETGKSADSKTPTVVTLNGEGNSL
jgi:hypothetical protein